MSLFDKLQPLTERLAAFGPGATPFDTAIDEVRGPTEVIIDGRPTLMCGSNNYFGLSFHPEVIAAAHAASVRVAIENTSPMRLDLSFATTLYDTVDLAEHLGRGLLVPGLDRRPGSAAVRDQLCRAQQGTIRSRLGGALGGPDAVRQLDPSLDLAGTRSRRSW